MIEQNYLKDQLKKYNLADATIGEMKEKFLTLKVTGVNDKEGVEKCDKARKIIKSKRVDIEKTRKALKADSWDFGQKVDAEAKRLTSLLEPIETHLKTQINVVKEHEARLEEEKKERERAKTQERADTLFKYGKIVRFEDAARLTEEEYRAEAQKAKDAYEAAERKKEEEERQRKEETERLAKIKKEQEEERKKLEEAKKAQEEKERKARDELEREARRLEEEKRKIEEEKRIERAKKEAAEQALREAEEKKRKEREEAEYREKQKPDLEKANAFVKKIIKELNSVPEINDSKIKIKINEFVINITRQLKQFLETVK
jgi:hypothetical protein